MDLLLKNGTWYDQEKKRSGDIRIGKGVILEIGTNLINKKKERTLNLNDHYLYPGLMNAHDHLEFNLYPKLGKPPYQNYVNWAKDIYHPEKTPVREIQQVPLGDRLLWGACKNVISGVTTVLHHNPYYRRFFNKKFPVKVFKDYHWANSLEFEKDIEKAYAKNKKDRFVIHAAEGIDEQSFREVDILEKRDMIQSNTILVHGIALTDAQINKLSAVGASIVWCPASNFYLFHQTAPVGKLKKKVLLALGTDSTLTGSSTLFDEMRTAYSTGLVSFVEIFNMVTSSLLGFQGLIVEGASADLLILPSKYDDYFENLVYASPGDVAGVIADGDPKYTDTSTAQCLETGEPNVLIGDSPKWICCDIKKLRRRVEKIVGNFILSQNPLWNLVREFGN
jgi:cytosine/adenosine deaminase-related metal-dependent hydrolase